MISRKSQIYVAYEAQPDQFPNQGENQDSTVADLSPEDAAEYIAALLSSLRAIAAHAQFGLLADLLSVAEEEAKLQSRGS
jgi:hypothetical protein